MLLKRVTNITCMKRKMLRRWMFSLRIIGKRRSWMLKKNARKMRMKRRKLERKMMKRRGWRRWRACYKGKILLDLCYSSWNDCKCFKKKSNFEYRHHILNNAKEEVVKEVEFRKPMWFLSMLKLQEKITKQRREL